MIIINDNGGRAHISYNRTVLLFLIPYSSWDYSLEPAFEFSLAENLLIGVW